MHRVPVTVRAVSLLRATEQLASVTVNLGSSVYIVTNVLIRMRRLHIMAVKVNILRFSPH